MKNSKGPGEIVASKYTTEKLESYLKQKILPELERGRPNFDKPHTKAVVIKLKEIFRHSDDLVFDKNVLLIAAYAHDWGYADLFRDGKPVDLNLVNQAKSAHMEIGAKKLEKLLKDNFFNFLTKAQKQRAIHLVRTHDNLETLKDLDELSLMEADVLGATDINLVKPGFDYESNKKWLAGVRKKKLPKFTNEYSKKEAIRLLSEREKYYENKLS